MRKRIEHLIVELLRKGQANMRLCRDGSPITSMVDDAAAGDVGLEQLRIVEVLRNILKEEKG